MGVHKTPTTAFFARLHAWPRKEINLTAMILHWPGEDLERGMRGGGGKRGR
jgi:hypothetical protein